MRALTAGVSNFGGSCSSVSPMAQPDRKPSRANFSQAACSAERSRRRIRRLSACWQPGAGLVVRDDGAVVIERQLGTQIPLPILGRTGWRKHHPGPGDGGRLFPAKLVRDFQHGPRPGRQERTEEFVLVLRGQEEGSLVREQGEQRAAVEIVRALPRPRRGSASSRRLRTGDPKEAAVRCRGEDRPRFEIPCRSRPGLS